MKVRSKRYEIRATGLFTDREEPRTAFWNKYHEFRNDCVNDHIQVLSYYGIGGIGKSCLLKKLMSEMEEKLSAPRYVYYDFKVGGQIQQVLDSLRNQLMEKYKFSFPLFELGLYVYCKKIGLKPESLEVKTLTERSPLLSLMMDVLGKIPIVSIAAEIFSLVEQGVAYSLTYLKKHQNELIEIEYMDAEELLQYLPYLFAQDVSNELKEKNQILVVFFDTYESLVNELSSIGEPLIHDEWIRGELGMIQNTSNTLWVIAGREKLKWNRFDSDWDNSLEQHILGNLSFNDTDWFLSKSGISNSELRKEIYTLTNGTPVYLDLCVNRYLNLSDSGIFPEIKMFGENQVELVERFVRYMSDAQKDLVYALACLGSWTDEMLMQIVPHRLNSFSISGYEKCKEFSFITKSDEKTYHFHKTVGQILLQHCPEWICRMISKDAFSYYKQEADNEMILTAQKVQALKQALKHALAFMNHEELMQYLNESAYEQFSESLRFGYKNEVECMYGWLFQHVENHKNEIIYAEVLLGYTDYLNFTGQYEESVSAAKKALEIYEKQAGPEALETLECLKTLAYMLDEITDYQESEKCYQRIFKSKEKILSEYKEFERSLAFHYAGHLHMIGNYEKARNLYLSLVTRIEEYKEADAIVIFMNLANVLGDLNDYEQAKMISEGCFMMCLNEYGEDHAVTLSAAELLSDAYFQTNGIDQAMQLACTVYDKRCKLLGECHPDTLITLNNIACKYMEMEEIEEAHALLQGALENAQTVYPAHHRAILSMKNNLVHVYASYGCFEEALTLAQEVLEERKCVLSTAHPLIEDSVQTIELLKNAITQQNEYINHQ